MSSTSWDDAHAEVHIYENAQCAPGQRPSDAGRGFARWVETPHEPDPRGSDTPRSWHEITECPFTETEPDPAAGR